MPRHDIDLLVEGLDASKQRELNKRLMHQKKAGYACFGSDNDPTLEVAVPFRRPHQMLDAAISTVLFRAGLDDVEEIGSTIAALTASS